MDEKCEIILPPGVKMARSPSIAETILKGIDVADLSPRHSKLRRRGLPVEPVLSRSISSWGVEVVHEAASSLVHKLSEPERAARRQKNKAKRQRITGGSAGRKRKPHGR